MVNFAVIEFEYLDWNASKDDDWMRELKEKIRALPEAQKRILYLYCDEGTYTGVARRLGGSPSAVRKIIKKIKEQICTETSPS